jgi:hypothetical protein
MNALLEGTEYNDVDSAIKGLYAKVGPISPAKARGSLDNLSDDAMRALRDKQKAAYAEVRDA